MADVRPIDANVLLTKAHNYYPSMDHYCLSRHAVDVKDIETAPTLAYEPVRHGEWIPQLFSYGTHKCSHCGWRIPYSEDSTLDARNYCPNCGAKMDGREDND